jgi:hypothetical protein
MNAIMTTPTALKGNLEALDNVLPDSRHLWLRRVNLLLAIGWAAMIPISVMTGWIYSIAFIAAASIYANFISHLAAWRADVPNIRD